MYLNPAKKSKSPHDFAPFSGKHSSKVVLPASLRVQCSFAAWEADLWEHQRMIQHKSMRWFAECICLQLWASSTASSTGLVLCESCTSRKARQWYSWFLLSRPSVDMVNLHIADPPGVGGQPPRCSGGVWQIQKRCRRRNGSSGQYVKASSRLCDEVEPQEVCQSFKMFQALDQDTDALRGISKTRRKVLRGVSARETIKYRT